MNTIELPCNINIADIDFEGEVTIHYNITEGGVSVTKLEITPQATEIDILEIESEMETFINVGDNLND